MDLRESDFRHDPARLLEIRVRFARKTHDHVGGQRRLIQGLTDHQATLDEHPRTPSPPHPATAVPFFLSGGHRVGKHEKAGAASAFFGKPLEEQVVLVIEHSLQSPAADVPVGGAVDGVADGHVIS